MNNLGATRNATKFLGKKGPLSFSSKCPACPEDHVEFYEVMLASLSFFCWVGVGGIHFLQYLNICCQGFGMKNRLLSGFVQIFPA